MQSLSWHEHVVSIVFHRKSVYVAFLKKADMERAAVNSQRECYRVRKCSKGKLQALSEFITLLRILQVLHKRKPIVCLMTQASTMARIVINLTKECA